jgi:hypothetical protein
MILDPYLSLTVSYMMQVLQHPPFQESFLTTTVSILLWLSSYDKQAFLEMRLMWEYFSQFTSVRAVDDSSGKCEFKREDFG